MSDDERGSGQRTATGGERAVEEWLPLKPQWFQILLALADRPRHGTGIRDVVVERNEGKVNLWPAMLYGSLRDLAEDGLIGELDGEDGPDDDRRITYRLTPLGRRVLEAEAKRLQRLVDLAWESRSR